MAPRRFSRYTFTQAVQLTDLDEETRFLSERDPYTYRKLPDNRTHVVKAGETLWSLAGRYFRGLPRAAGLWWVIADFQPRPIHDPTIQLTPGQVLYIPSPRVVQEEILSEIRRRGAVV